MGSTFTQAERVCDANTPEWLESRRSGIGASESAAACGLSKWEAPLALWARKTEGIDAIQTDVMLLGNLMEPAIREYHSHKTGLEVVQASPGLFRHKDLPYVLCSPDAFLSDGSIGEYKRTSWRVYSEDELGEEGSGDVPVDWFFQAQHTLSVIPEAPCVRFGVLLDGTDLKQFVVERDQRVIDGLLPRVGEFWSLVEGKTPPDVDFTKSSALSAVKLAYRSVIEGTSVALDTDDEKQWSRYQRLGKVAKACKEAQEKITSRMLAKMKDNQTGKFPSGANLSRVQIAASHVPAHTRRSYIRLFHKKAPKDQ